MFSPVEGERVQGRFPELIPIFTCGDPPGYIQPGFTVSADF
jgi:hypothetical protein